MRLDLTPLAKAIGQMDDALQLCASDLVTQDERLALHHRAAAIQAFEFSYELSVKMLRRYLAATESNPAAVAELSFNDLIRLGLLRGLLCADLADWQRFRSDRGATSHTYDEDKAADVFESIPTFMAEARFLLSQIAARQERQ